VVSGNVADNGALVADIPLGPLILTGGSITGGGSLVVAPGGTLDIFTTVHYDNRVQFGGAPAVLRLQAPAALQGAISGFGVSDVSTCPG
jgi:hypothetical protein